MNRLRLEGQLLVDEGLRLKPYRCTAGRLTIGVGRNLDDRGITESEALVLLNNDISAFWGQLAVSQPWVLAAPEEVQEALVNMSFNLGLRGLLKFQKTLEHMRTGQYREAASAMLDSSWARQVGARAERLAEQVRRAEG
ncbi:MAG: glycoside hydrolase family protein [Humidesulfovibrio sp.]|jgi:lysozyme|uniref:glycoside hydrolase family protein n=1 Tax=Humidesulfovibrio sp. TaxID=2910988 RepID=UPI00273560D2|nr:glycoside hydrolase family protein [Humidesulfovibrio sp.]MDP2848804.1 glycoside hydrolase family protein [Humidesulfovibrio sp.]